MKKIIILVFIILLFIPPTYAYWSSSVSGNNSVVQGIITIGTWEQEEETAEWVSGQTYQPGDVVEYNGNLYVRTSIGGGPVGGLFAPDSFLGWLFWSPTN
jgi:predicted ribosomally synthesized peptide with SipW-like signal peptide